MEKPSLPLLVITAVLALLVAGGFLLLLQEPPMPEVHSLPPSSSQIHPEVTSGPTAAPTILNSSESAVDTSDWKVYRNEKYGFELYFPWEWRLLKSDSSGLQITHTQNAINVSILDFRSSSTATFHDWVHERPSALISFHGREALRWYTRGVPTPIRSPLSKLPGTEHFIIPSEAKDWAVAIHMRMEDARACSDCVQIFDQLARSLVFGGAK